MHKVTKVPRGRKRYAASQKEYFIPNQFIDSLSLSLPPPPPYLEGFPRDALEQTANCLPKTSWRGSPRVERQQPCISIGNKVEDYIHILIHLFF